MAKETQLVNSGSFLEKRFHLKENHTNVRTEIIAGLTTFLTCTYILAVNPAILSSTGMDSKAVLWATAISAAIACIAMGLLTNFPFALAPAMGPTHILPTQSAVRWGCHGKMPWPVCLWKVLPSVSSALQVYRSALLTAFQSALSRLFLRLSAFSLHSRGCIILVS